MPLPGSVYAGYGQCEISPSDLASAVDNLWNQVIALKQEVELLKSANTIVGALDEITPIAGTLTDATLINAARGWSTPGTFSGVAISTLGWTMSDGCTFPIVVMQDGALQFGLGGTCPDGSFTPVSGVLGTSGKIATVYSQQLHLPSDSGSWSDTATWTIDTDPYNLINVSTTEIIIQTAGWYHVTMMCPFNINGSGGESILSVSMNTALNTGSIANDPNNITGGATKAMRIYKWSNTAANSYSSLPFTADRTFYLDAGMHLTVIGSHSGAGTGGLAVVSVALQYLKAA